MAIGRWTGRGAVLTAVCAAGLLLATGCGSGGEPEPTEASPTSTGADEEPTTPDAEPPEDSTPAGSDPAGDVPDPCALLDTAELAELIGSDPGEGTVQGPQPDQRQVCFYPTGVILAVEVAANWEGSISIIEEEFGDEALEPVAGVGSEAFWQADGLQFLALGTDYCVGVTGVQDQAAAQAVAEAMLAAI